MQLDITPDDAERIAKRMYFVADMCRELGDTGKANAQLRLLAAWLLNHDGHGSRVVLTREAPDHD